MARVCFILMFSLAVSCSGLQFDRESFEYQLENADKSFTFDLPASSPFLFIKVTPCNGLISWKLLKPTNDEVAQGSYTGFKRGTGTQLASPIMNALIHSPAAGKYTIKVSAGYAGWKAPNVFYTLFLSTSAIERKDTPQLPINRALTATLTTVNAASLTWDSSPTSNVEYCLYYHKASIADDSFVYSTTCASHFTHQQSSDQLCTTGTTYELTGLMPATEYNVNMIIKMKASNARSAYTGVVVKTLSTTDGQGRWGVTGRVPSVVLNTSEVYRGSLGGKQGQDFYVNVPSQGSSMEITVKPCGGYFHWLLLSPDQRQLDQGDFSGERNPTDSGGHLTKAAKTITPPGIKPGTYEIQLRAGCNTTACNVYFELLATTNNHMIYPELPPDDCLRATSIGSHKVILSWDPSPTQPVKYCVFYYPASLVKSGNTESSSCNVLFGDRKAISGPCTTSTGWTLENRTEYSRLYADTTYHFHLVVLRQDRPELRSSYAGIELRTTLPTLPPPTMARQIPKENPVGGNKAVNKMPFLPIIAFLAIGSIMFSRM
eukprot:m.14655 g.14655  ORF g.14655 m.14655 type:complete len:545 (+) comp25882_c0_seq1:2671-4305(+)